MGIEAIIATLVGVAGVVGAFFGGKRTARSQAASDSASESAIAVNLIEIMKTKVELLEAENLDLKARVGVLEALVTQRAEVEQVRVIVEQIKSKLDA